MSTKQTYNPSGLLDEAIRILGLKNDAALCRALDVQQPHISKVRNQRSQVGPALILKLHEIAGMPVPTIRQYIGGWP